MSASLCITFLDSASLGEPTSVEQVVQVFAGRGFEIDTFKIAGEVVASWAEYATGASEAMQPAYSARELRFVAFNPEWRLEVFQQLGWGRPHFDSDRRAWVRTTTTNTPYFWRAEYNPPRYSRFMLDIGKSLYEAVQPSFGWLDFDYGLRTTHEDIEALRLPVLYWANFFGPPFVDKVGRDRILAAPARLIEPLADGGLLYVLASSPGLEDDHVPVESVKAHFGVEEVR